MSAVTDPAPPRHCPTCSGNPAAPRRRRERAPGATSVATLGHPDKPGEDDGGIGAPVHVKLRMLMNTLFLRWGLSALVTVVTGTALALATTGADIAADLDTRTMQALADRYGWADVRFDGRDALVTGTAGDQETVEDVVAPRRPREPSRSPRRAEPPRSPSPRPPAPSSAAVSTASSSVPPVRPVATIAPSGASRATTSTASRRTGDGRPPLTLRPPCHRARWRCRTSS